MVLTTCLSHPAKYASPRSPKINNMADKIIGTFNLTESEGFDEFMKALGVGMVMRKMGNTIKPSVTFTLEAGTYTMKTASSLKTREIKFKLGEKFTETTMDGHQALRHLHPRGRHLHHEDG